MRVEQLRASYHMTARQVARMADLSLLLDVILKTNSLRYAEGLAQPTRITHPHLRRQCPIVSDAASNSSCFWLRGLA